MRKLVFILALLLIPAMVGADSEVQDLDDITSPAVGDDMYIVDSPDGTPASKKINIGALLGVGTDLNTSGEVAWSNLAEGELADSTVVTGDIKDGTILVGDMAANSIDSDQYVDGSIDEAHMSANSIDSDSYVDASIDNAHLADNAVDSAEINTNAVQLDALDVTDVSDNIAADIAEGELADSIVITDDIKDGTILVGDMAVNSIDSDQYVDGSIDEAHMSANSIDSDSYVDASIDEVHMSVNSIDSDSYVDGSIDLAHMSSQSVDSDNIVDDTVESADYAAGSIDLEHMSSQSVDSDNIVEDTIVDADIDDDGNFTFTGTWNFGGASIEIENAAGDVVVANAGEVAVDSTQEQLVVHDGNFEIAIPLRHMIFGNLGLDSAYDRNTNLALIELDATVFPDGIVITGWEVDASEADPTTELDANLTYCDDATTGAFPGANPTLVDVLDTTTGNSSEADMSNSDLASGVIPAGKFIYIDLDADPADTDNYFMVKIEFYIPES